MNEEFEDLFKDIDTELAALNDKPPTQLYSNHKAQALLLNSLQQYSLDKDNDGILDDVEEFGTLLREIQDTKKNILETIAKFGTDMNTFNVCDNLAGDVIALTQGALKRIYRTVNEIGEQFKIGIDAANPVPYISEGIKAIIPDFYCTFNEAQANAALLLPANKPYVDENWKQPTTQEQFEKVSKPKPSGVPLTPGGKKPDFKDISNNDVLEKFKAFRARLGTFSQLLLQLNENQNERYRDLIAQLTAIGGDDIEVTQNLTTLPAQRVPAYIDGDINPEPSTGLVTNSQLSAFAIRLTKTTIILLENAIKIIDQNGKTGYENCVAIIRATKTARQKKKIVDDKSLPPVQLISPMYAVADVNKKQVLENLKNLREGIFGLGILLINYNNNQRDRFKNMQNQLKELVNTPQKFTYITNFEPEQIPEPTNGDVDPDENGFVTNRGLAYFLDRLQVTTMVELDNIVKSIDQNSRANYQATRTITNQLLNTQNSTSGTRDDYL